MLAQPSRASAFNHACGTSYAIRISTHLAVGHCGVVDACHDALEYRAMPTLVIISDAGWVEGQG